MKLSSDFGRWALLPLLFVFAGCGEDDPSGPECDDPNPPASCVPPEEDGYAFVYEPPAGAPAITSVVVRGDFNQWGPPNGTDLVLEEQADGTWLGYADLDSTTTYAYKFVINGQWINDMCSDATWGHDDAGGLVHLETDDCVSDGFSGMNALINLSTEPGLGFTHSSSDPAHVSVAKDRLSVRFRARSDRVESARLAIGNDTIDMHVQLRSGLSDVWRASSATTTGSYTILLETTDGPETFGPYTVPAGVFRSVPWASEAVAYQIFPERFWNGDPSNDSLTLSTDEYVYNELWTSNGPILETDWYAAPHSQRHCCHQYYGGDLAGIVEKLEHLVDLGVTAVYLNPIWHSGSAHGYDTFDYMRVAPEFGDSAMLRTLVDASHAAGIRLIWDFVPNHVGLGHWAFQDVVEHGESSDYINWFNVHPDGDGLQAGDGDDYDGWWGFGSLPELSTEVAPVFDHLMDVARGWTQFGFDGIRVDVPGDIDNRPAFFSTFRSVTKAVNPDVYLVGEIWERDPSWLQGTEFDALMNYAIGREVIGPFALGQMNATSAWNAMAQLYVAYPEAASGMLFNVIATHDTNRLLTFMGGGELGSTPSTTALARQRLASAFQYAIPGMPVTYYGDECAMLGSNTGEIHRSRRTMDWNRCAADEFGMVEHYRRLAEEKQSLPALQSTVIREHRAAGTLLSFYRGEPGPGEVLAVFNQGGAAVDFALPAGTWVDALIPGDQVTGSVVMPAYGWRYLVRQ